MSRAGYRAQAERDGRVEVTARGSSPIAFHTVALGRGADLAAAPPRGRTEQGRVVFERGPVREDFRPGEDGLEQSWHFSARPPGEGQLQVKVSVSGASAVTRDATGLRLQPEHGAPLRYGNATWIDADGKKTALLAQWNGREIELSVPAALVDASRYPAVLDPLISPERPVGVTTAERSARSGLRRDRPRELGVARRLARRARSGRDHRGPPRADRRPARPARGSGSAPASRPRVAFDGASTYLVVWSEREPDPRRAGAASDGAVLDATPLVVSNDTTVSPTSPSVAYGGGNFLVLWNQNLSATNTNRAIRGARISSAGQLLDAPPLSIAIDPNFTFVGPRLASNGSTFLAVFRGKDIAARTAADLWGITIDGAGTTDLSPFSISGLTADIEGQADVGFDGSNYLVAWEAASTVRAPG